MKKCYPIVWSIQNTKKVKNSRVTKTKKGKPILLSKWAVCDSKKFRFIKEQEASGLSSSILRVKLLFEEVPKLGSSI